MLRDLSQISDIGTQVSSQHNKNLGYMALGGEAKGRKVKTIYQSLTKNNHLARTICCGNQGQNQVTPGPASQGRSWKESADARSTGSWSCATKEKLRVGPSASKHTEEMDS